MARVNVPVTEITQAKATLTTACSGSNNDLVFTAKKGGTWGNAITVAYVVSGASTPLSISVSGFAITVNVATTAGSAASSTATAIKNAIAASPDAAALVTVAVKSGDDGSGVVAAFSATALSGGLLATTLPSETAGDATNKMVVTGNDGTVVIKVRNSGASTRTCVVNISPTASPGVTGTAETLSITAGSTIEIGPLSTTQYNQNSSGDIWLDPSHADLVFRAYKVTAAS